MVSTNDDDKPSQVKPMDRIASDQHTMVKLLLLQRAGRAVDVFHWWTSDMRTPHSKEIQHFVSESIIAFRKCKAKFTLS